MPSRRPFALLCGLALALAACTAAPAPSDPAATGVASASPDPTCGEGLPPRTSPDEVPRAVLHVNDEDVPPVVGDIDYDGPDGPVVREAPGRLHAVPFLVVQTNGERSFTVRMTDAIRIAEWRVFGVPNFEFRSGAIDANREEWGEGQPGAEADAICLPLRDGDWLIGAELTFADDLGSGTYFWRVNARATGGQDGSTSSLTSASR